jgi:hypothetical protein
MSKMCSHCKIEKPADQFGKNRRLADGLASYCRPCARIVYQRWYATHAAEKRAAAQQHRRAKLQLIALLTEGATR